MSWRPSTAGSLDLAADPLGSLRRPPGIARADHDRLSGASPAQREAVPERAGPADDRNWLCHRRASYRAPGIGCAHL